tara:strand:+ start:4627 stop:5931 length:1305 start_codon:yes stop_codon:yes gene_type:complete
LISLGKNIKKVFKNAGILASGDIIAAIFGLISFGILGRSLGVNSLGAFSVIITYVTLIEKFFNFQSWQALIKYGNKFNCKKEILNFNLLNSFGLLVDIFSAIIAFLLSITLCNYLVDFFNWSSEEIKLIKIYSIVILFNIEGVPTAIFRIQNKFLYFSKKAVIISSIKLILFFIGWSYSFEIDYYIYSTLIAQIIGYIFFLSKSLNYSDLNLIQILSNSNIKKVLRKNPKFLSFLFQSNIQSSLKLSTSLFDTLLVSKYLGDSAAGLLQVAKQFSKIFTQISSPLYKSIYPELASLWQLNNIKEFKLLILNSIKITMIASSFMYLLFVFFGKFIIMTYIGLDFINSYYLMVFYFLGNVIQSSSFPLSPAFLAMGYPRIPLITTFISSLFFIIIFILTYKKYDYLTIGISYALMTSLWLFLNIFMYKHKMKKYYD